MDITRKKKSLRKKSGRKSGGQTEHDGSILKMVDTPDEVKDYQPNYCEGCGAGLSKFLTVFIGRRQTIEIPSIKPITI